MKSNDLQIENDLTMPKKNQLKINMYDSPSPKKNLIRSPCLSGQRQRRQRIKIKENRLYIGQSLSMNFVSHFQPEMGVQSVQIM